MSIAGRHLKVMQTQDVRVAGWDSNALRNVPGIHIERSNHDNTSTTKYPNTFLKSTPPTHTGDGVTIINSH